MVNLIFIHGGPACRDYLAPYFEGCFPSDFRVTFYDQLQGPGVGVVELIGQLASVIEAKPGPVFLVGHSWGGTLALEYLRERPRGITGLVLLDACISNTVFYEEFEAEMKKLGIPDADTPSIFFSGEEKPQAGDLLERLYATLDTPMFERIDRDYLSRFDLSGVLANLRIPVLNVFGGEDVRIPARCLRDLGRLNQAVETLEIRGAGHFPFVLPRNRDQIVDAIVPFVRDSGH